MPTIPNDQKFHTLSASTPTEERGSAQINSGREIYTMQDVIDTVDSGGGVVVTSITGTSGSAATGSVTFQGTGFALTTGQSTALLEIDSQVEGNQIEEEFRSNPSSSAGDYEGRVLKGLGNTAPVTTGTVYMFNSSGDYGTANADAEATAKGLMVISTESGTSAKVLTSGIIYLDSVPGSVGDVLYLSTTNGTLTDTAPTTSTHVVRVMGYKLSANTMYFDPSKEYTVI